MACPGRLEDLLKMGALRLDQVTAVVIDEADQMADMGFLPAVRRIVGATAAQRQVLLFSATLEGPVAKLVDDFQDDPCLHEVGEKGPDITAAQHIFWLAERTDRPRHVAGVAAALGSTLVFVRTRHGADRLAKQLDKFGTKAEAIHGGRSQAQRDRALDAFKRGKVDALIATDVAARGVHVDGIACVLHFDPPADASTYHHRSGRTARAGATGVVISLVDASMRKATRQLQQQIGVAEVIESPDPRRLVADVVRTEISTSPAPSPSSRTQRYDRHRHRRHREVLQLATGVRLHRPARRRRPVRASHEHRRQGRQVRRDPRRGSARSLHDRRRTPRPRSPRRHPRLKSRSVCFKTQPRAI